MLRTIFALVISTGLVACVTDDSTGWEEDSEERAQDPDLLTDPEGNQVGPTGVKENPGDAPGMIPASNQNDTHVPTPQTTTADLGMNRDDARYDSVITEAPTRDLDEERGNFDNNHVDGQDIGFSCDGQSVDCRAIDASKATR